MASPLMSLPAMTEVRPPFHVSSDLAQGRPLQESRLPNSELTGLAKATSLPALERPPSNMLNRSGLPPGVVSFQNLREAAGHSGAGGLPRVNEFAERPGTGQCTIVLEKMMTSRMGLKPPSRQVGFRSLPASAMNMSSISVQSQPQSHEFPSSAVSSCLQSLPAKTAARARMRNLKNFYAMPPRPVSRARPPHPHVTLMGVHGGQAFAAEDWHYKHHGYAQDRRVRHDHVAGDMGRA